MHPLAELIGESPKMIALRDTVARLLQRQAGAGRLAPILIQGETGTGKGLLVRAIHRAGLRAGEPFVDVNCAAIPETLLEAELFGYERGAFTDARQAKPGLFQAAHRGTIFLDEIGLLPAGLQSKLLKVIEERLVRRLGSTRSEAVDVWIIAASNEDLLAGARARRFREDLYHRLAGVTLRLPPLRERGRDVLLLAEHLLVRACADHGVPRKSLAPDASAALLAHRWPGNVRELANVMGQVALLSEASVVGAADLGLPKALAATRAAVPSQPEETAPPKDAAATGEPERLLEALSQTQWNISHAAARLGISRNTLRYRIEKHGLGRPAEPQDTMARELGERKAVDGVPHNLPQQLTSFVGRQREIAEVKRLLATSRLLTLTGAGGCGKTRLALQVAADLLAESADGVWLIELGALTDPALVPQAVASALGVREEPDRPLLATLAAHLQPRQLILLLDNCEHLVVACAHLAEVLLRACSRLRILVTSREALGIPGETPWRVPSLSLPDPQSLPPLDRLSQYEAIRLFVERATAMLPTFTLTSQNAATVVQVCYQLDGIPLAIELAAARVKVLTVEQINGRLNDRFRLLTGGSRTGLPRHQTLRAAMDWSHDLLSEAERVLLRRMSVFAGGFTLEAAETVCAGAGVEDSDVLALLSQLIDKSLVMVEAQGDEARYRLLETIREYGREKLLASGEATAVRGRHRDWYLTLAERAEAEFLVDRVWLDRLETEYDNLRAALQWSQTEAAGAEAGLRLAAALWRFWEVRGPQSEGRGWLEALLSEAGGAPPAARAQALNGAANLARNQGDYSRAVTLHEEALQLRRELGDTRGIAASLNNLGVVAHDQGNYARAAALLEEALTLWREVDDKHGVALSLNNLARTARFRGDHARATALGEESRALWGQQGHPWGLARALNSLGDVAHYQGDYDRAVALYDDSLALRWDVGDKQGIAVSLGNLGKVAERQGDYDRAAALGERSLALRREVGDKRGIAVSLHNLGKVAQRQADDKRAATLYADSLALRRDMGDKSGIAACLEALADLACTHRLPDRAAWLLGAAEALRDAIDAPLPPADRADHEGALSRIHAALNEDTFRAAWAEGRAMRLDEAIGLALEPAWRN